jgi:hypothetical protein
MKYPKSISHVARHFGVLPSSASRMLLILTALICLQACKPQSVSGTYTCSTCLIGAIDIKGDKACIYAGTFIGGQPTGCYDYKVQGNMFLIKDPRKGDVKFEKINDHTLKGSGFFKGNYTKK